MSTSATVSGDGKSPAKSTSSYFRAGDLDAAVAAAIDDVKKSPANLEYRWTLCELLCFQGAFERADKQLEALASLNPTAALNASTFRQIIRGEMLRQAFHRDGTTLPEVFAENDSETKARLELAIAALRGDAETGELLSRAEANHVPTRMTVDGTPVDDFRDLDDVCAPALEVLSSTGRFFWVAWPSIISLTMEPPRTTRELLFREAHLSVRNGPEGTVYIPTLYAGAGQDTEQGVALGRATLWTDACEGQPVRGRGLRMLYAGTDDQTIMEISELAARESD